MHYSIKKCKDQTQRRISASGMAHNFVFDAILLVCKWERSGEGGFLLYYYTSCCATVAVRR